MATTFIRIEKTLEQAMYSHESPLTEHFDFSGIQLLPNHPYPYRQTTSVADGIELEDWNVRVMTLCGREIGNISDWFNVDRTYQYNNGKAQFDWTIWNCPLDFGEELIYLQIEQINGEIFYTSPFMLTSYNDKFTSRFDYRESEHEPMLSVGLNAWFRNPANADEISTYYETSTGRTVTSRVKTVDFERWRMFTANFNLQKIFRDMLYSRELYVNLRQANIYEAFEIGQPEARENFSGVDFSLTFGNATYNPVPEPQPAPDPNQKTFEISVYLVGSKPFFSFKTSLPSNDAVFLQSSYVEVNGEYYSFLDGFIVGENIQASTESALTLLVGENATINSLSIRFSGNYNYLYGGGIFFTPEDIQNNITKTITATIQ